MTTLCSICMGVFVTAAGSKRDRTGICPSCIPEEVLLAPRKLIEGRSYCGWCSSSDAGVTRGVYACYCDGPCATLDCPELLKADPVPVPRFAP